MKIGFISMPLTGHLNPMTALARKLESRGNEVVFIGLPDAEPIVRAAGLDFVPFCEKEFPPGSIVRSYAPMARMQGEEVVRYSCQRLHPARCRTALEHLPEKLKETGVEALVIDTIHFYIELVPMSLGMPYVHVWNILHIDRSGLTPPCFFSWPYETNPGALARNKEGLQRTGAYFAPILAVAKAWAEKNELQVDWNDPTATLSKLAVITQTPREFDFPGVPRPPQFHYTGPFHDGAGRAPVPFPWEKLTGQPLIYASMGTITNSLHRVFRHILEAVETIPEAQLVLSVSDHVNPDDLAPIPQNAIVVHQAPQLELLERAALCITHAGANTTLEALAQGVPMVAIPVAFDQPGLAARIAHHGVGEFVHVGDLTADSFALLVQRVLKNPGYRERAQFFRDVIAKTRGLEMAADVIERAFAQHRAA